MRQMFFVRHAETLVIGMKVLKGAASALDPISELGHKQATACGKELASRHLHDPRVYSSTYLRAEQTARNIAKSLGVEATVLDGLHEMNIGQWAGRSYSALHTHAHELIHADGTFAFPGGEGPTDVEARSRKALAQVCELGGTPIIVSHGLALNTMLCDLLGIDFLVAYHDGRFDHPNTGISELVYHQGRWGATQVAFAGHLTA